MKKPYSSQQTWDVPRPVQFDSDVRKRVITVEANKLECNPIQADGIERVTTYSLSTGSLQPSVGIRKMTEILERLQTSSGKRSETLPNWCPDAKHTGRYSSIENSR